jgi:hypothetical protein
VPYKKDVGKTLCPLCFSILKDPSLAVSKWEKPVSCFLMNAHREKQRFIMSVFSAFHSLFKIFDWISVRSITLIYMVGSLGSKT